MAAGCRPLLLGLVPNHPGSGPHLLRDGKGLVLLDESPRPLALVVPLLAEVEPTALAAVADAVPLVARDSGDVDCNRGPPCGRPVAEVLDLAGLDHAPELFFFFFTRIKEKLKKGK